MKVLLVQFFAPGSSGEGEKTQGNQRERGRNTETKELTSFIIPSESSSSAHPWLDMQFGCQTSTCIVKRSKRDVTLKGPKGFMIKMMMMCEEDKCEIR